MADQGFLMGQKGDAGFIDNQSTVNSFTPQPPQPPRSRLSTSQLIMRASAVVGLLAFSWRLPDIWAASNRLILRQTTPNLDACPGYSATTIKTTPTGLTAQLHAANGNCNVYGPDLRTLSLTVTYETGE
jgi:hypothetical protein